MKKLLSLIVLFILFLSAASQAAIQASTNLANGKSAYGTFSNPAFATDGKIRGGSALSGDITDTPQYLTVDLGTNMYLDRVKIYWDKDALSNDFIINVSGDAKYWNEEARGLDASFGVLDSASNTMAVSISLKRAMISSRYVQIMVPAGSKINNTRGNTVRIAEVEVYPSLSQKFTLDQVGVYAPTDSTCLIKYNTSIGVSGGSVSYGTDPAKLDSVALNSESGVVNSVVLSGLKPRTIYFYQVKTWDFFGNTLSSTVNSFTTLSGNVALKKKVTGTFTVYPANDKFVKAGAPDEILARITDGGTSYFTSMATSGPVPSADQYVVIDLGRSYNIKSIVSYWRKLAYPESLTVQVSDNNSDWKIVADGTDASTGTFARSDAGDPMEVLNIKGLPGRYVMLLAKKGSPFFHKHSDWNYVQLMEVQVFAE